MPSHPCATRLSIQPSLAVREKRLLINFLGYNLRQAVPFMPSIRLVTRRLCFETRSLSISGFPVLVQPIADIAALSAVGLPLTCDLFTHRAVNDCEYRGAQAG
jgi:hypothetical protein